MLTDMTMIDRTHDSVPINAVFRSHGHDCLLLEEPTGTAIYRSYKDAWWFWRCATKEEVAEILAATGND